MNFHLCTVLMDSTPSTARKLLQGALVARKGAKRKSSHSLALKSKLVGTMEWNSWVFTPRNLGGQGGAVPSYGVF